MIRSTAALTTKDVDMISYQDKDENSAYQETKTNPSGFFHDTKSAAACSVRVAVRVRPLVSRELIESPNICIKCYDQENQLVIGKDRAFTFDKVFEIGTRQQDVFDICVKNLVLGTFQGFNATVLAYGQTGSGKTFTMGSGYTIGIKEQELGIIPRVIKLIFDEVEKRKHKADIVIKCAFSEIYNEEIHDLLDHQAISGPGIMDRFMQKKEIQIREEKNGSISLFGLREDKVSTYEELAACLDKGSNFRSTASTLMNNCSSRSHAIFTITIEQSIIDDLYKVDAPAQGGDTADEYMVAKFHFVDLAGSERAKRTGATGSTLKEGISINKGLLSLGNVIAALTEDGKNHVPYRDSKLTRILQDSLGGNSRTSMIACVSPAEINFEETLNSLKYASRARNIKNAPKVNRDPNSAQIVQLRQQVFDLQRDLLSCKKLLVTNNIDFDSSAGNDSALQSARESINGQRPPTGDFIYGGQQIQRFEQEIKEIKMEKIQKEKKISQLQAQIDAINDQSAQNQIEFYTVKKERDVLRFNFEQVMSILKKRNFYQTIMDEISNIEDSDNKKSLQLGLTGPSILEEYQAKSEEMQKELQDKHQFIKTLQKDYELLMESSVQDTKNLELKESEIERLKRSVNKLQKENVQIKNDNKRGGPLPKAQQTIALAVMPSQRRSNTIKSPIKKPEKKWISEELENNIQNFNDMFIENLSQLLVKKPAATEQPQVQDDEMHYEQAEEDKDSEDDDENMPDEFEIVLPKNEQELQQVIESNEEVKKEDEQIRANLIHQEQQIVSLEDNLKDKESLLQAIKDSHKFLSGKLLEDMKNEYHKKIASFQQEISQLEQERSEQLRKADSTQQKNKLEESYKRRLKDLEEKVNSAKQKEREQQNMQKQSSTQKTKIKSLEFEIEKMKTQKVIMMKRMKEESEQHRKWKAERVKELVQVKSQNVKKDREIQMLRRENKKKDQIAKRKQEELSAFIKKSKIDKQKQINGQKDRQKKKNIDMQYLKDWIIQNTEKMLRFKELMQQKNIELEQRKEVEDQIIDEQNQHAQLAVRRDKLEFRQNQLEAENEGADEEEIYAIKEEMEVLTFELKAIQDNLDNLEEKQDFIEGKITNLTTQIIEFNPDDVDQLKFEEVQSIEGARACLGAFFGILLDVNVYKRQLEVLNMQHQTTIDNLGSEIEELKQIQHANEVSFQKQIDSINIEYQQKEELLIKLIMENGTVEIDHILAQLTSQNPRLQSKDNDQSKPQPKKGGAISNAKLEIQKNNQQMYNQSKTALSKRVAELEREKKDEQKKYETIKHKLEQVTAEKEVFKRQLDTVRTKIKQQDIMDVKQSKTIPIAGLDNQVDNQNSLSGQKSPRFNSFAMMAAKETAKMQTLKDVRNERKIKKMNGQRENTNEPRVIADEPMDDDEDFGKHASKSRDRRPESTSGSKQEASNDVFKRLLLPRHKNSQHSSFLESNISQPVSSLLEPSQNMLPTYEDDYNWKCQINKEQAHNGQICAIASIGNQLYSTSSKNLKIWDLENMQIVSDISAHSSIIRSLIAWEAKTLLVTASEKTIILWDMVSLTQVAQLKGHKEEIRALAVGRGNDNLLYSGGKGSQQGGSLLIWDLRKGTSPCEEKEKNQDVFSLAITPTTLFMGCRNHYVYPINLKTLETNPPFEPPHFDAVTSLALLSDDTLISGSRDKNLRCWDSKTLTSQSPNHAVMGAHNDWINTLETDHDRRVMYSGCKDGSVKVWKMKHNQLKCAAQLSLPQQSTNPNGIGINTITKIDKQFGQMFATGGSDKQIRIWKHNGSSDYEDDNIEDGQPDFEMVDEHPTRQDMMMDDDMFEFDTVQNNAPQQIPKHVVKHQQSQKVEEVKKIVPSISRTSSQMMPPPSNQPVLGLPYTMRDANKLEAKRREKRLQDQARKSGQQQQ